jgi:hypothetical protein
MKATALLLNWKRKDNLIQVIDAIKSQTVGVEIILWNNNPEDQTAYDVDIQINASSNLLCWPRWLMASYASTEYVFTNDDDLMFADNRVIQDCIRYVNKCDCMIGYAGVKLSNKGYFGSMHISQPPEKDTKVNILKGRFMFLKKEYLKNVPIIPYKMMTPTQIKGGYRIEDDLLINHYYKGIKVIPSFLQNRIINLPEGKEAYSLDKIHKKSREITIKKIFKK